MGNTVARNGKTFVRQAKLPRGAYPQKPLPEVIAPYRQSTTIKNLYWENLKENRCPKCFKNFMIGLETQPNPEQAFNQIMRHGCGFRIRDFSYRRIVSGQITGEIEEKMQQEQEELL